MGNQQNCGKPGSLLAIHTSLGVGTQLQHNSRSERLLYQSPISAATSCKRTAGERASLLMRKLHSSRRFAQGCRSAIPNEINAQKQNQYISVLGVCGVRCHPKSRSCAASDAVLSNHSRLVESHRAPVQDEHLQVWCNTSPEQMNHLSGRVRAGARIQNSFGGGGIFKSGAVNGGLTDHLTLLLPDCPSSLVGARGLGLPAPISNEVRAKSSGGI
jgi:hypothetical protein